MPHLLIADPEECSCFLMKSILLGKRYGVSISTRMEDARMKLETGLFDGMVVDFAGDSEEIGGLVKFANDLLPAMPVLALYRENAVPDLSDLRVFATLTKPIRVSAVCEAVRQAMGGVGSAPGSGKRAVRMAVDVAAGRMALRCRATDVSRKGLLIEAEPRDFTTLTRFHEFFSDPGHDRLTASLQVGTESLVVPASIAFAERTPDEKVKQIGLRFEEIPEEIRTRFEAALAAVA